MNTSEQINEIAAALAKAHGEMDNPVKDAVNPHFGKAYADLSGGLNAVRGPLSKYGIAVVQATRIENDGWLVLDTRLVHSSGQWIGSEYPVCKLPVPPQQAGSALTYARRYALFALAGVAGEDDDANDASGHGKPPPPVPPRDDDPLAPDDPFADNAFAEANEAMLESYTASFKHEVAKMTNIVTLRSLWADHEASRKGLDIRPGSNLQTKLHAYWSNRGRELAAAQNAKG